MQTRTLAASIKPEVENGKISADVFLDFGDNSVEPGLLTLKYNDETERETLVNVTSVWRGTLGDLPDAYVTMRGFNSFWQMVGTVFAAALTPVHLDTPVVAYGFKLTSPNA